MGRTGFRPDLVNVELLFGTSVLRVPEYQRAYAWEEPQWRDLWIDIREGMANGGDHFLGTVVLQETEETLADRRGRDVQIFELVDGQQRVTTIALLMLALRDRIDDREMRLGIWTDFFEKDGVSRIELGGTNRDYYESFVQAVEADAELPESERATNRRLRGCFRFFQEQLRAHADVPGATSPEEILKYMRQHLQTLRFVTEDRALAIRTFQAVNDRGLPLTLLEKTKSLLMFFAGKCPDEDQTFHHVQRCFGQLYEAFDRTMDAARKQGVAYLVNPRYRFSENELLTFVYHFASKYLIRKCSLPLTYAFDLGAGGVLDGFLKPALDALRGRPALLKQFIHDFAEDLAKVAESLDSLIQHIDTDPGYQNLFLRQGVSASVYPLLIGLESRNLLDAEMLEAVAVLDLRVYKVRGTDPRAWLYRNALSRLRLGMSREEVLNAIVGFTRSYGSDAVLDGQLRQKVYKLPYVKYVLWEMALDSGSRSSASTLAAFGKFQVDHILAQTPEIDLTTCGFTDEADYNTQIHRIGNLCLLEDTLNEGAQNKSLTEKAGYYTRSSLEATRLIGRRLEGTGFNFTRDNVERRVDLVVEFFHRRWPIPTSVPAMPVEENGEAVDDDIAPEIPEEVFGDETE